MRHGIKAEEAAYNHFIHYDSDVVDAETKTMKIRVPFDGWYYWSAHNISIEYPDDYEPDEYNAYLCTSGFKKNQKGIVIVSTAENGGKTINGALYPMREPADQFPKCKVYNKIFLSQEDFFMVSLVDKNLDTVDMNRIAITFHISSDLRLIYID